MAAASDTDALATLRLRGPSFVGMWVGGATHSGFRTRTGVAGHRDFYLTAIRLSWPLGTRDPSAPVRGAYFIDVLPYAVSTGMPEYVWDNGCQPGFSCPGAQAIPHTVSAFGITPLGWVLSLGGSRVRADLEASGGALYYSRPIPDPEATRFNFTFSAGPVLEIIAGQRAVMRLGYLWHHTSNGGTGRVNPGLNSGVVSAGLAWRSRESGTGSRE